MPEVTITKKVESQDEILSGSWYKDGTETVTFDGKYAIISSIQVKKTAETGFSSAFINWGNQTIGATTKGTTAVCTGIKFNYRLTCIQKNTATGTSYNLETWTFIPASVTVVVKWSIYEEPPVIDNSDLTTTEPPVIPDITPTDSDPVVIKQDTTTEEWEEQEVILREGLNIKCIDKTHKETQMHGEIRATENIINGYIAEKEQAKRIGEYYINQTGKTRLLECSTPPFFSLVPGKFVNLNLTYFDIENVGKVEGVKYTISKNQSNFSLKIRTKEE